MYYGISKCSVALLKEAFMPFLQAIVGDFNEIDKTRYKEAKNPIFFCHSQVTFNIVTWI